MTNISVIIPTYNSSRTLSKCLDSVKHQSVPPQEILVVDRFSVDGTPRIGKVNGVSIIQADVNRSVARNIGLHRASSEGVLFIDADMILPLDLLQECESALEERDAVLIPEVSVGFGYWARCKSLERQLFLNSNLIEAARCFRKDRILSLGGFDPELEAGEDWYLQRRAVRAGLSFARTESKIIHDEGNLRLGTLLKKKYLYGKTMRGYLRKNPTAGLKQINPFFRILYPSIKVVSKNPSYGIGIPVMKTLEFLAAGLGLASTGIHIRNPSVKRQL